MSDYQDGILPITISADTSGLTKDDHIYNATDNLSIYDHLKEVRTKVDDNLDTPLSNGIGQVYQQLIDADESVAQSITLDTKGHGEVVSIYAHATTATTFTVDVSNDNTNWINFYTTAGTAGETDYSASLTDAYRGFRYVKLSSDVAGGTADTVTLIICAK